ncbi:hypothetical protein pipiens_002371 [Culex pipiens pipiens]|uniref:Uncharacterized protein n=1 Tax=Culex pipiens pipiens TaxID=38569 RepID=A0ABD1DFV8_CULPP
MNPPGLILAAVLLAVTIAAKPNEPSLVTDYLVAVIRSLASRYPGVHQCVFFGAQLKLSNTNMFDPCYWNHLKNNKIDIDVTGVAPDENSEATAFEIMETSLVSGDVFAVPRSAVSMVQLFTMPFSWQVWTTLALILAMAEIVHLLFPGSLKNDPILLVLCGFEKYDLHRSGQLEKFLLMPLIVLMFFAICAYETKLLSLMTSKPAAKTIRTIQELVDSGIQIKANLLTDFLLINNTMIRNSLVNATVDIFNMDMVHAYLLVQSTAEHFCTRYYDPDQRIHRNVTKVLP